MPADGSKKPKIHRLTYPDGDNHDAEALLLNGDGTRDHRDQGDRQAGRRSTQPTDGR